MLRKPTGGERIGIVLVIPMAQNTFAIGIDGGGTSSRFALLHNGRRVEARGGSANASSDLAATRDTLTKGLTDLASAAGLAVADLRDIPTFIGLAGMVDPTCAQRLVQALPLTHVQIEDDRRTAMVGALGVSDGCVMGIGTGTFFGRRAGGVDRLIGGWGLVLGDEASGAHLGRALLRQVVRSCDGMCAGSAITQKTFTDFGSSAAIIAFATQAQPTDFAQFAPAIVEAALTGDATAQSLMIDGATHITQMLRHLGWQAGERICPHGGLAAHYAPYLGETFAACLTDPEGTALDGALRLAVRMEAAA